eukprot:4657023-Prymnesium_polylepis.1
MSHAFRSGGVGTRATAQDIGEPSPASRLTWSCQSAQAARTPSAASTLSCERTLCASSRQL